ncbi:MAG: sugar-specific transcriptional regulator TrmB [Planctomycetota bacterium]|jgi:sugar-specific transcriptional regulator TrmB
MNLSTILQNAGITGTPQRVYQHLLERGPSSARQIAELLSLPRPTVYDALHALRQKSLVNEDEMNGKKLFSLSDPLMLDQILREKTERLDATHQAFLKLLPELGAQTQTTEPRVQFFSGPEDVKQVANDLYWYKDTEIRVTTHITNMMQTLGVDDLKRAFFKRLERGNSVRAIWSSDSIPDFETVPWLRPSTKNLFQVRVAPSEMQWALSYREYDNRVTYISSPAEMFAIRIHSNELAATMRTRFEHLWNQSTPLDTYLKKHPRT